MRASLGIIGTGLYQAQNATGKGFVAADCAGLDDVREFEARSGRRRPNF